MKAKIKTIDIQAKEWFDKTYGNSYFAGSVCINFGMPSQQNFSMPFQYGYGDSFYWEGMKTLQKNGLIPKDEKSYWQYCDNKKIVVRSNIQRNCLKRDLKYF